MCAKAGGIPWSMNDLPFSDRPTMLVGVDMFQKINRSNRKYVTGMTSTMDRPMAKYFSDAILTNDIEEAHAAVYKLAFNALTHFQQLNNFMPQTIIVYREGASEGQHKNILEKEVQGSPDQP